MKKTKKYTIVLFVCFFAFMMHVSAKTYNLTLVKDRTLPIWGQNMSCTDSGSHSFISISNSSDSSRITYNGTGLQGDTINISCQWDIAEMGGVRIGHADYVFKLENDPTVASDVESLYTNFMATLSSVSGYRDPDTNKPVSLKLAEFIGAPLKSYNVTAGGEYITFEGSSCTESKCNIFPSEYAESLGGHNQFPVTIEFVVTLPGGDEFEITGNIIIDLTASTRLYPGNYDGIKCSWDSWKYDEKNGYYYTEENVSSFPTCTSTSTELEFKGWSTYQHNQVNIGESNRCYNLAETITPNKIYFACVESKKYVQITFGKGTLKDSTGWHEAGSVYSYKYVDGDSVALPELDGVTGFVGWHKGGYSGPLVEAGTVVPLDDTRYFAEITNTIYYTSRNKTIRTEKTMAIRENNMTGCSVGDSSGKLSATMVGTECQVTAGSETTGAGETIKVNVTTSDSATPIVYNFTIIKPVSVSVDTPYLEINLDDNENYKTEASKDKEEKEKKVTIYGETKIDGALITEVPENVYVHYKDKTEDIDALGTNADGKRISSQVWELVDSDGNEIKDENNNVKYWSYCLDANRYGPQDDGKYPYVVESSLTTAATRVRKLVTYLAMSADNPAGEENVTLSNYASYVGNVNSITRIAVHHSVRLAILMDNFGTTDSKDSGYEARHKYYVETEKVINSCGADQECYKKGISEKLVDLKTYTNNSRRNQIIETMAYILAQSYNVDLTNRVERKINVPPTEVRTEADGTMVNDIYGYIYLPAGASDAEIVIPEGSSNPSPEGITRIIDSFTEVSNADDTYSLARKKYEFHIILKKDPSVGTITSTDEELKEHLMFNLKFKGMNLSNFFIMKSKEHENWQRMLAFSTSDSAMTLYFPFQSDCGGLAEQYESTKDDELAKQIVANKCCDFVGDTSTNDYLLSNCGGKCTNTKVPQICSYSATPGRVDVYKINEATVIDNKEEKNKISVCVVNTNGDKVSDYKINEFNKEDDNGHLYNVADYSGTDKNKYCEVTCKEDWTIVMEAYGNYVGKNAVAAGTYFRIKTNDTFISGKTECYTSYINYKKYTEKVSDLSEKLAVAYNDYSHISHIYTDIEKQGENNVYNITFSEPSEDDKKVGCVESKTCAEAYENENSTWDSTEKKCYHMEPCGSSGASGDATPDSGTGSGAGACVDGQKKVIDGPMVCKTKGKIKNVVLATNDLLKDDSSSANGTYTKYNTHQFYSNTDYHGVDNNGGNSTKYSEIRNSDISNVSYKGKIEMECEGHWVEEPGKTAENATCKAKITDSFPSPYTEGTDADGYPIGYKDYVEVSLTNMFCKTDEVVGNYCPENDSSDGDKEEAYTTLKETMYLQVKPKAQEFATRLTTINNDIYKEVQTMFNCQHFQLNNETPMGAATELFQGKDSALGAKSDFKTIKTKYKPTASYNYDDDAYMTLIGSDNVIEPYEARSCDQVGQSDGCFSGSFNNTRKEYEIKDVNDSDGSSDVTTEKVFIANNYLESSYYWTTGDTKWEMNSDNGLNYHDKDNWALFGRKDSLTGEEGEDEAISKSEDSDRKNGDSSTYKSRVGVLAMCYVSATDSVNGLDVGSSGFTYSGDLIDLKEKSGVTTNDGLTAIPTDVGNDPYWRAGLCFNAAFEYNDVNYVKSSITNGSFYKNKGDWYFSEANSLFVAHGVTTDSSDPLSGVKNAYEKLTTLSTVSDAIPKDTRYWSKAGQVNVFPISYTAPRNLYTYTYSFKDFGYYQTTPTGISPEEKNPDLSRIMGRDDSIVAANTRTCFYEVYEEFCICCGSDTYSYGDGLNGLYNSMTTPDGTPAPTNYTLSDLDNIKEDYGVLGLKSSTVQLGSFTYGSDSILASNWGEDTFYYDGYNYVISKGAEVLNAIESKGETIYSQEVDTEYNLEYSFILKPDVLAEIKEYNQGRGYGITYEGLNLYGRYYIGDNDGQSIDSPLDINRGDTLSFVHYGSEFLESILNRSAIVRSLADRGDAVCSVTSANDIKAKMQSGCRWVDYIEEVKVSEESPYYINKSEFKLNMPSNLRMAMK